MSWNYRVIREKYKKPKWTWLTIREVYYDDKDRPVMFSKDAMSPGGENTTELACDLEHMVKAFSKPVLDMEKLVVACSKNAKA